MEFTNLGKSGLHVSKLCLGTMTLGEADETSMFHGIGCKEEEAFAILDYAIEAGINFIDTANVYGQDGMAEKLLGRYFNLRKNRDELVLATKFRFTMGPKAHQSGASRKHIMWAVEESLKRLNTDYVDLYQVHMQDYKTPEEETLRALDDLVRQGKVRYLGASNYAAYRFLDALHYSDQSGLERYISLQMQYSMACRGIEWEHIPLSLKHGVGIMAWSPLAGGMLSGKHERGHIAPGSRLSVNDSWRKRFDTEANWRIVGKLKEVALRLGHTPAQVALAWLLKKPGLASAIIGARKLSQAVEIIKAADMVIPDELWRELDEVSAPEIFYPYNFVGSKEGRW